MRASCRKEKKLEEFNVKKETDHMKTGPCDMLALTPFFSSLDLQGRREGEGEHQQLFQLVSFTVESKCQEPSNVPVQSDAL